MKKLITTDGRVIVRKSRWIRVRNAYDVTPRHSLWYYAMDGYGRRSGNPGFDPSEGIYLDYFVWNGRKYAIERFMRCGSVWCPTVITWEENDKLHAISGIDSEEYFRPILIELDECGEYVRVYEEE